MTRGSHTPSEGDVLDGRYLLEHAIGRGGMGMVFLAQQINLERKVAVKVLAKGVEDRSREYEARFRREALAASRLYHPNIVQVMDYGRDRRLGLFLVMEYLDGRNFGEIIARQSPLAPERVADLLIQTLAALEAAHQSMLLHRDIKPANIMVCNVPGRPDFVKVLDFGIARALEGAQLDDLKLTREGSVCGTPTYMAPEQAVGRELDGRADLYAVAAILYEMLTNELPFKAKTPTDYLIRKVNEDPPAPDTGCDGRPNPPGLVDICARGMARDPDHRFEDAPVFRRALERWLQRAQRRARRGDTTGSTARASRGAGAPRPDDKMGATATDQSSPLIGGDDEAVPATWADMGQQSPEPAPVLRPRRDSAPATGYPAVGAVLLGREELLAELGQAMDRAATSGWDAQLVVGPPGSGRSRMLAETARRAGEAGWEVLRARPGAPDVSPFLLPSDLLPPPRDTGPRLILVDDADLLPAPLWTAFLQPVLFQDRPTLLVGATTGEEPPPGQAGVLALLPLSRGIRLALGAAFLGDRVILAGPEQPFPAWLQQRAFLAMESGEIQCDTEGKWFLHQASAPALPDLSQVIRTRVAQLDPRERKLVRLLSLSPRGLVELPPSFGAAQAGGALKHLAEAGLATDTPDGWMLASRTVAETVAGDLGPAQLTELLGDLVAASKLAAAAATGPRSRTRVLQEAVHREQLDQHMEAASCLEIAAQSYMDVQLPERAVPPLRHAHTLSLGPVEWTTDRIRITAILADALTAVGEPDAALEVLDPVQIRPRLDPRYPGMVSLSRGLALSAKRDDDATSHLEEALRLAMEGDAAALHIRARAALADDALRRQRRDDAALHVDQARTLLGQARSLRLALQIGRLLVRIRETREARHVLRKVIEGAEAQGVLQIWAQAMLAMGSIHIERGDPKQAARFLDAVRAKEALDPVLRARASVHRGLLFVILRDRDAARACYLDALSAACAAGWSEGVQQATSALKGL